MYFDMSDYRFIKIEKADNRLKKYQAILSDNNVNNRFVKVSFGGIYPNGKPYTQFKDTTNLKLYSKFDNNSDKKRKAYKARHTGFLKDGFFSPGYFSMKYLW